MCRPAGVVDQWYAVDQWWFFGAFYGSGKQMEMAFNLSPVYRFLGVYKDDTLDNGRGEALQVDLLTVDTEVAREAVHAGIARRGFRALQGWRMQPRRVNDVEEQMFAHYDGLEQYRVNRPRQERERE